MSPASFSGALRGQRSWRGPQPTCDEFATERETQVCCFKPAMSGIVSRRTEPGQVSFKAWSPDQPHRRHAFGREANSRPHCRPAELASRPQGALPRVPAPHPLAQAILSSRDLAPESRISSRKTMALLMAGVQPGLSSGDTGLPSPGRDIRSGRRPLPVASCRQVIPEGRGRKWPGGGKEASQGGDEVWRGPAGTRTPRAGGDDRF